VLGAPIGLCSEEHELISTVERDPLVDTLYIYYTLYIYIVDLNLNLDLLVKVKVWDTISMSLQRLSMISGT
jgi:hypothetical protein